MNPRALLFFAATLLISAPAPAGVPDFGYQWATITDPGNRPTRPEETVFFPNTEFGAVDHVYRMSTTEVSVGQWFEFVGAFLTVFPGRYGSNLTGIAIDDFFMQPELNPGHTFDEPANMSWEYAARYANWLHNDKAITAGAFSNGVYDTSTFTFNPDGSSNHQMQHDPGAKFWIPTHDEWVKAAYWDPDKNAGEGGYWKYPYASDTPPVSGFPEDGGMTNVGAGFFDPEGFPIAVGSYPNASVPWGLFDVSGGMAEYTETGFDGGLNGFRWRRGSWFSLPDGQDFWDASDWNSTVSVRGAGLTGLRVAAQPVPAPPALVAMACAVFITTRRRKRGIQCNLNSTSVLLPP